MPQDSTRNSVLKIPESAVTGKGIPFRKTHDLLALMELCLPFAPELELHKDLLAYLNQFAVIYRYPGELAEREQAKQAIRFIKILRPQLRAILGLYEDE